MTIIPSNYSVALDISVNTTKTASYKRIGNHFAHNQQRNDTEALFSTNETTNEHLWALKEVDKAIDHCFWLLEKLDPELKILTCKHRKKIN